MVRNAQLRRKKKDTSGEKRKLAPTQALKSSYLAKPKKLLQSAFLLCITLICVVGNWM